MNQLIVFLILFSTCLQQPEKTFTSYPECGGFCTDLKFEISKFGIKVKWGVIDLQEVTRVEVERSRDAQNFATIALLVLMLPSLMIRRPCSVFSFTD